MKEGVGRGGGAAVVPRRHPTLWPPPFAPLPLPELSELPFRYFALHGLLSRDQPFHNCGGEEVQYSLVKQ